VECKTRSWLPWLLLVLAAPVLALEDIHSQVRIDGEWVFVELSFSVAATRDKVWEVLTDFEHMAGFISNLKVSNVISRDGDTLQVYQSGKAQRGLLVFPFEGAREIHLTPKHRIESHLLRGSMKQHEGLTEITSEGAGETRVVFHGQSVPGVWIPPVVGKGLIEQELREQWQEMRAEIVRRQGPAPGHGPGE
jgi:carbon monoxide dehydrogenase subunit G